MDANCPIAESPENMRDKITILIDELIADYELTLFSGYNEEGRTNAARFEATRDRVIDGLIMMVGRDSYQ